ncbi:MAG: MFS transporter [Nocardioides sp.]
MSSRNAVGRHLASFAAASLALSLPWPLLLVLAWDRYGDGPHGPLAVGLTAAARMLPYVLLSWVVGSLGDRIRRDRLLTATLVLRSAFLCLLAVALLDEALLLAVVAAALAVACGTPAYPTLAASMPGLAGSAKRRATEALVTVEVAAWVVGPALGGLLLMPPTRPFIASVAVALTLLATVVAWRVPLPGPTTDRRTREAVSGMIRVVLRAPRVLAALAVGGMLNIVGSVTVVALLPLSHEVWHRGDAGFGVATAWFGFGALAAPLFWWVRGSGRSRQRWGLAVLGLAVAGAALSPLPVLALPVLGLAGAVSVLGESAVTENIQDGVADEHRAGALGLGDAVMVSCAMAGSLAAPLLAAALGARGALVLLGSTCLVVVLPAVRRLRRTTARQQRLAGSSGRSFAPLSGDTRPTLVESSRGRLR